VFIGEAQPPIGRYAFCKRLVEFAKELGVERVFTFAAMATQMRPEDGSRVFAAATDATTLTQLRELELEVLEDGQIGGLNGVLLGAAAEAGMRGGCLLGEMPGVFVQLPFPQASLAVLSAFRKLTHVEVDLSELAQQAEATGHKLEEILTQVEHSIEEQQEELPDQQAEFGEEAFNIPAVEEPRVSPDDEQRIEQLFDRARENRSKAYELKGVLDRLGVFDLYEDRFLDLFKKAG
jgi:proteasome assembly chaperone (PAC2) family protein